jgi:hypothetical protein
VRLSKGNLRVPGDCPAAVGMRRASAPFIATRRRQCCPAAAQLPRFPVRESGSARVQRKGAAVRRGERRRRSHRDPPVCRAWSFGSRPWCHPHRDWAHPSHICTGTGLTPATSAPGLGSPVPHLHRDWAHPCHICCGTGLTPCYICTGTGSGGPDVALPRLVQCPRGARAGRVPAARR